MNILILYYSGVGNTKMVATKIFDILHSSQEVTLASIEKINTIDITTYDGLAIGFPTIHAAPAQPILTFIEQIKRLSKPMPTFLFTTCGLYSANTLRIFSKKCLNKNIIAILCKSYRCAATDGILIAPVMKTWFHHEKNLDKKLKSNISQFINQCNRQAIAKIPRFKIYSILNYPNKFFGQRFQPKIYVHKTNCISCGKCIVNCPIQCIYKENQGYPLFDNKRCIHCYRCIHHCPNKALSLSKKRTPSKTLYY